MAFKFLFRTTVALDVIGRRASFKVRLLQLQQVLPGQLLQATTKCAAFSYILTITELIMWCMAAWPNESSVSCESRSQNETTFTRGLQSTGNTGDYQQVPLIPTSVSSSGPLKWLWYAAIRDCWEEMEGGCCLPPLLLLCFEVGIKGIWSVWGVWRGRKSEKMLL